MLSTNQPQSAAGDSLLEDAKPACVALVPVAQETEWSDPPVRRAPPDPTFVTHLMATADQIPPTGMQRRAATAVALSAYRSHQMPQAQRIGFRTRQII